jgi:hypothetical protein
MPREATSLEAIAAIGVEAWPLMTSDARISMMSGA